MKRSTLSAALASVGLAVSILLPSARAEEAIDPAALAELPHWPMGWHLPPPLGPEERRERDSNADVTVWLPPGATRIRAVLVVPNNTDSKDWSEHGLLREFLARHETGILYMRRYGTGIESAPANYQNPPADTTRMPEMLKHVAQVTGVAEFEHAPWITFGKSSRGSFPFRMGWLYPERTIASIGYHGETPTWPPPSWAKFDDAHTILHLNANGETEWGGTWFVHVRPSLLNYNTRTPWLGHVMVARGIEHGNYGSAGPRAMPRPRVWDYMSHFVDKALALRLPEEGYPTDGPITLQTVDPASGYLIDPFAVEELFQVPHFPLQEGPDGFRSGSGQEHPVSGFVRIEPPEGFEVPEGVPVVQPDTEVQGFKNWILTEQRTMQMAADPMLELSDDLRALRPVPGDEVTLDGTTFTFRPIRENQIAPEGGIRVPTGRMTMLAYTVLEVPERRHFKLAAPFTPATRQQAVIAGVPVAHDQVVELGPGRYPLLHVVRMSVRWGRIGPWLVDVSDEHVALAKQVQAEADERAAEQARIDAEGREPPVVIRKASAVPEAERGRHLWVADRELAREWFKMHAIHGQEFQVEE